MNPYFLLLRLICLHWIPPLHELGGIKQMGHRTKIWSKRTKTCPRRMKRNMILKQVGSHCFENIKRRKVCSVVSICCSHRCDLHPRVWDTGLASRLISAFVSAYFWRARKLLARQIWKEVWKNWHTFCVVRCALPMTVVGSRKSPSTRDSLTDNWVVSAEVKQYKINLLLSLAAAHFQQVGITYEGWSMFKYFPSTAPYPFVASSNIWLKVNKA